MAHDRLPTFSGLQLDGAYPITNASFENITITDAGTDGIYLTSAISGDASFSFVTVSDSAKNNFLNYAPKLLFTITLGEGNVVGNFCKMNQTGCELCSQPVFVYTTYPVAGSG